MITIYGATYGPSTASPPPTIVTSGLVGYWDGANTSSYSGSGSTWNNISGTSTPAASFINGVSFNNDAPGSFNLNGSNQYIDMTPSGYSGSWPSYSAAMTWSIWFKTSVNTPNYSLGGPGTNPFVGSGRRLNFWVDSQAIGVETCNDYRNTAYNGTTQPYSFNTWYNVTAVDTGSITTSQIKVYINGVLDTTAYNGSVNASISVDPDKLVIGIIPGYVGYYFSGTIALPMFYNRALSDSEVLQNFNAHKSRFGI